MYRILLVVAALVLSACAQVKVTLPPYTPVTTDELNGSIMVNDFSYSPKQGVAQNQIRETAAGTFLLTENVGVYFANALRRELRQAGVSLKNSSCTINGIVNDFAIDDLGYSADYITDVRYVVTDANDSKLFENTYKVKFTTSKFVVMEVLSANINKSVSDNISQLMKDPGFTRLLTECKK